MTKVKVAENSYCDDIRVHKTDTQDGIEHDTRPSHPSNWAISQKAGRGIEFIWHQPRPNVINNKRRCQERHDEFGQNRQAEPKQQRQQDCRVGSDKCTLHHGALDVHAQTGIGFGAAAKNHEQYGPDDLVKQDTKSSMILCLADKRDSTCGNVLIGSILAVVAASKHIRSVFDVKGKVPLDMIWFAKRCNVAHIMTMVQMTPAYAESGLMNW